MKLVWKNFAEGIRKNQKSTDHSRFRAGKKGKLQWMALVVAAGITLTTMACSTRYGTAAPQQPDWSEPEADVMQGGDADSASPESLPVEQPELLTEPTRYDSGMYRVGTDIPAGEYVLFAENSLGYMEVDSDSSGNFESILCNDNFSYNTIVTVEDGNYLSLSRAYAVPLDEAELDTSGNGMFKVGVHIPAGEYKVVVDEDSVVGMGYLEVSTDSSHQFASIRTNDNIESSTYITVNDGEYLTLDRCHIEQ